MRISAITTLLIAAYSATAWSLPSISKSAVKVGEGCNNKGIRTAGLTTLPVPEGADRFAGIRHTAAFPAGATPPIAFSDLGGTDYAHPQKAIQTLKKTSGKVTCLGKKLKKPFSFHAAMVGVKGVISTVAHNFAKDGKKFPFESCVFDNGYQAVALKLNTLELGTKNPADPSKPQYAFVTLEDNLLNENGSEVEPLPVLDEYNKVQPGDNIYGLNSSDKSSPADKVRPLTVTRTETNEPNTYNVFGYADKKDSGALEYGIDQNDQVIAVGMTQSDVGADIVDGQYNDTANGQQVYNISLSFDGVVLNKLQDYGLKYKRQRLAYAAGSKIAKAPSTSDAG